jgi:hypothetical protein
VWFDVPHHTAVLVQPAGMQCYNCCLPLCI